MEKETTYERYTPQMVKTAIILTSLMVIGGCYSIYHYSTKTKQPKITITNPKSQSETIKPKQKQNENEKQSDNKPCNKLKPEFGKAQSPINIISNFKTKHTKLMPTEDFHHNALRINYPDKINNCTILNNSHTVQINIPSESKCTLSIKNKTYYLRQFHFHTPSEHLIDSKQYEMEMHLVHTNESNEIAVLGFIFTTKHKHLHPKLKFTPSRKHLKLTQTKLSKNKTNKIDEEKDEDEDSFSTDEEWDDDDKKDEKNSTETKNKSPKNYGDEKEGNDFLEQFWDELPTEKTEKDIRLKNALSFDYLFQTASNNFIKSVKTNEIDVDMELFEYMGSLTTPPYTEGVQWLVSKTTHFINNDQLHKLSGCWGHENNARDVQEYHGRVVTQRSQVALLQ